MIGAQFDDIGANTNQGSVYVFTRTGDTWTRGIKAAAPDGRADELFGVSVATSGDSSIVGAGFADVGTASFDQGAAYLVKTGHNGRGKAR